MLTSDNLERTRKNWISSPKAAGIFRDSEVSACDSHVVAHQCSRTVGTCSIVCFIAPKPACHWLGRRLPGQSGFCQ